MEAQNVSQNIAEVQTPVLPRKKISICFHPTYLATQHFSIGAKKIIIGYNQFFDVCIALLNDRKSNFIELTTFGFSNFFLQCEKMFDAVQRELTKSSFNLEENITVKLSTKTNETTAVFDDNNRQVKISFTEKELLRLINYRNCFSHVIQKFIFSKGEVEKLYSDYTKICSETNANRLEPWNFPNLNNQTSKIDLVSLFYEIPNAMPSKLERDIYFNSIVPTL